MSVVRISWKTNDLDHEDFEKVFKGFDPKSRLLEGSMEEILFPEWGVCYIKTKIDEFGLSLIDFKRQCVDANIELVPEF